MLAVKNKTKNTIPLAIFKRASDLVLGKKYELSVVVCADGFSRNLNKKHRGKDKPANVLSFPLSKTSGELFLNPGLALRESKNFDRTPREHLIALFLHGLFHLKGFDHGSVMDKKEAAAKRTLGLSYKSA